MSKLGFIGLGIMGAPMCGHLIDDGHTVFVHARRGAPAAINGRATEALRVHRLASPLQLSAGSGRRTFRRSTSAGLHEPVRTTAA